MNQLRERQWKSVYRTGDDNLLHDFYLPALACATYYDRAVGFFSSELLIQASRGLSNLIKANGKMRLVIGHPLDHDEYLAVKQGQDVRWAYDDLKEKVLGILSGEAGEIAKYRLELLTWMLASGSLEIKFAFRKKGMYHEKIGIIADESSDRLVFSGSANETYKAMDFESNAESLSVFPSWNEYVFESYGRPFELGFEALWTNNQRDTCTVSIPSTVYESMSEKIRKKGVPDLEFEERLEVKNTPIDQNYFQNKIPEPYIPEILSGAKFEIGTHQKNALLKWKANDYKGILKLATGSGKTITAIYGGVKIYQTFEKLVLIVAVPYNELANQWIGNLNTFGIAPHKCFDSKNFWYDNFKLDIQAFVTGARRFVAAVVINKTMQSEAFRELVALIPPNALMFVGDECHRHGAEETSSALPNAGLRMGLSATPFRSEDDEIDSPFPDEGRRRLIDYYGDVVYEYNLSDAINDGILTPYRYHVLGVHLTQEEQEQYEDLSRRIGNLLGTASKKKEDRDALTLLCGQRSRLLGSAENKLHVLESALASMDDIEKGHVLFYCAEGSSESEGGYTRNIDKVSALLNRSGWRTSQFTSMENAKERAQILNTFLVGGIDALVSMKVLDEGIDIPACKSAFILASTKNPRQYVQRRGRILRKFRGKDFAVIYDFVLVPAKGWEETKASRQLTRSEMERVDDFLLLAKNKKDVYETLEKIGIPI